MDVPVRIQGERGSGEAVECLRRNLLKYAEVQNVVIAERSITCWSGAGTGRLIKNSDPPRYSGCLTDCRGRMRTCMTMHLARIATAASLRNRRCNTKIPARLRSS